VFDGSAASALWLNLGVLAWLLWLGATFCLLFFAMYPVYGPTLGPFWWLWADASFAFLLACLLFDAGAYQQWFCTQTPLKLMSELYLRN
jgi:hypothetical protein